MPIPIIPDIFMLIPFMPILFMLVPIIPIALNGFPFYWLNWRQSACLLHSERTDGSTYATNNTNGSIRITSIRNASGSDSNTVSSIGSTQ